MRNLKYAILGLLSHQSMTGYDLMQQFESALCEFWSAKHSQIYPELKKLTNEGMIQYEVQISGQVLKKKLYSITEEGKKDFMEWLSKVESIESTPKDIFRLRLFFSNKLSSDQRLNLLTDQLEQHRLRLSHLRKNQQKFAEIPEKDTDEFSDYLVLLGGVMREEQTCNWLEKCMELIKES